MLDARILLKQNTREWRLLCRGQAGCIITHNKLPKTQYTATITPITTACPKHNTSDACSRKQSRILVAAEILFCPRHAVDVPWSMNKNNTLRQSTTTLLKTQQHTGIQVHYMTLFKPAIRLHCLVKLQLSTRNSLLNCRTVHNQPGTTPRPMQPTQRLPESSEAAKLASASAYSGKSSLCQTKCQTIHRDHRLCCCRLLDGFTADPGIHTPPRGGHWI